MPDTQLHCKVRIHRMHVACAQETLLRPNHSHINFFRTRLGIHIQNKIEKFSRKVDLKQRTALSALSLLLTYAILKGVQIATLRPWHADKRIGECASWRLPIRVGMLDPQSILRVIARSPQRPCCRRTETQPFGLLESALSISVFVSSSGPPSLSLSLLFFPASEGT